VDGSAGGFGLEPAGDDSSPSHHAATEERIERITGALDKLAPDYRQVVRMRNLEGRTFVDIAEQMGRPRRAVSRLWSRAIVELGALLEENDDHP
jgi:RNA polymerase sigma-70 factor (ECF subfamily)